MVLGPRLDLRQTQSLVMTPQLQQAIKLLQLSSLELSTYVDQQVEQNPFLDTGEGGAPTEPAEVPEPSAAEAADGGDPRALDRAMGDEPPSYADAGLDSDFYGNVFDHDGRNGGDGAAAAAATGAAATPCPGTGRAARAAASTSTPGTSRSFWPAARRSGRC